MLLVHRMDRPRRGAVDAFVCPLDDEVAVALVAVPRVLLLPDLAFRSATNSAFLIFLE
jgi:hypothetical protein